MKQKTWIRIAALLPVVFLWGCKSTLDVPLVDLSLDSRPNATIERQRNGKLEDRVHQLERENRELRERLDKLEHSAGKESPKSE